MKKRNVKSVVRPSSATSDQKIQDDLQQLTSRLSNRTSERADDWLTVGDWLAAGERIKTHRPQFKLR